MRLVAQLGLSSLALAVSLGTLASTAGAGGARRCDPPVKKVLEAALAAAQLAPGLGARLRRRLRWSALLPRLSVRLSGLRGQGLSYDLTPGDRGLDGRSSSALRWEVRLAWDLGRLAYDHRELALLRARRRAAAARRKVVAATLALYYARRAARRGRTSSGRFERLSAELDALTGGLLTHGCGRPPVGGRPASAAAEGKSSDERGAQTTPTLQRTAPERIRHGRRQGGRQDPRR